MDTQHNGIRSALWILMHPKHNSFFKQYPSRRRHDKLVRWQNMSIYLQTKFDISLWIYDWAVSRSFTFLLENQPSSVICNM